MQPATLIMFNSKADALDDRLVGSFTGSICLWVEAHGHLEFNACELVQCGPEVRNEELVSV